MKKKPRSQKLFDFAKLNFSRLLNSHHEKFGLILIVGLTTFIYTFVMAQKHMHFQTFAWDTSVFDQQIYLLSKFKTPFSSLHGTNGLADHFHPLLLIVGGVLYNIWNDPRSLFFLQSLIFSLSAFPLFLIAKHFLKRTDLKEFQTTLLSFALCVMYLYSVSSQAMILDEIHDDVFSGLPILLAIYFLLKKNTKGFWLSFLWLLLTKEEYGLLGPPLGVYLWLKSKNPRQALVVAMLGLVIFIVLIKSVMPTLGGQDYPHILKENEPIQILTNFTKQPSYLVTKFFDKSEKRKTWIISIASFGLLPVFAPAEMIFPVSALAIRFYDDTTPRRFDFNNHYASPFIPLLAVATVSGLTNILDFLAKLLKRSKQNSNHALTHVGIIFILGVTVFQDFIFKAPLNSLYKKSFYETLPWQKDAYALIQRVPKDATLASNNSLLPHLSQRERFYLLPEIGDAQYIAVDLANGPNKFAAYNTNQIRDLVNKLILHNSYHVIWEQNDAMLLKKCESTLKQATCGPVK